ncbi:hypothetical protein MAE02_55550 [Microvirga aerophila]|uniref:Uncharacterized protein n=1 Tax=Microvirga aerophila TaxID=670291 RepID=A0A512C0X8_9HYPH|nr:hypothetical protein MAE02_55550 [Microvirga aerophila]
MNGYSNSHTLEKQWESSHGKRSSALHAGEDKFVEAALLHLSKNFDGAGWERNPMFPTSLHPSCWHGPEASFQVNLIPPGSEHFARASRRQD